MMWDLVQLCWTLVAVQMMLPPVVAKAVRALERFAALVDELVCLELVRITKST